MENKYPEGSKVTPIIDPNRMLVVRRFAKHIYYCTDAKHPLAKDLVYFERELMNYETA